LWRAGAGFGPAPVFLDKNVEELLLPAAGRRVSCQTVRRFRIGQVTAAVWKNDEDYSVTLQNSYKDGED
jgi:hypothetical protein